MESDQRVIIKYHLNERANARDITERLHKQFGEYTEKLGTVQFRIAEIRLGGQDFNDEIRT
jgi:hypothetical protein